MCMYWYYITIYCKIISSKSFLSLFDALERIIITLFKKFGKYHDFRCWLYRVVDYIFVQNKFKLEMLHILTICKYLFHH